MTNERAIEVIKTEKKCVLRNMRGCDRKCENCDLVMKSEDILLAYDIAIMALMMRSNIVPVENTVSMDEEDDRK